MSSSSTFYAARMPLQSSLTSPSTSSSTPSSTLLVKTLGNREVIATKAKSFLQLIDGKIQDVNGDQLKIGDYLPASRKGLIFKSWLLSAGVFLETSQ
jgi:hypothetical protein